MRSEKEDQIKLGDRICVLLRQNARLSEVIAELSRQLADVQQMNGDLLHQIDHYKYTADHATKLLEDERKLSDKSEEKVK